MRRPPSLVWIFSFADLAFILVLALTILPTSNAEYAKFKLSEVVGNEQLQKAPVASKGWRLFVVKDVEGVKAITLQKWDFYNKAWESRPTFENQQELEAALQNIKDNGSDFEFLADQKSQTGSMLLALSLIQKIWPEKNIFTTVQLGAKSN